MSGKPQLPPVDEARFRALYEAGARARDICAAFGRSAASKAFVPEMARRFGLPVRPTGWKPPGWSNNRGHGPRGHGPRSAPPVRLERSKADPAVAAVAPATRAPGEADAIARFIAERGVTRCPPAAVAPGTAALPGGGAAIRRHAEALAEAAASMDGRRKVAGRAAALARGGAG